jgi:hypothetical protein
VEDVVFMGSIVRCRVQLADAVGVIAEMHNDEAAGLAPGAAVPAGWSREHVVILQA